MDERKRKRFEEFLEGGATPMLDAFLEQQESDSVPSLAGERIGPYRLVREIGHGGMSLVYLAEREDGEYEEQVAVKILRHPGPNEELFLRFKAERQILADLVHPNIARILDGGISDNGWPYLVMEYVKGRTFVEHAADLPLRARLALFQDVCAAVQHAHQYLVVHRDLKPSNILVSNDGVVKLLDFGIAKLLGDEDLVGTTPVPHTSTGLRLMTPEYAAPEQVRGEAITTGTDVYALGILLYQLLTGERPYRLDGASPREIEERICEMDPPPPESSHPDLDTICIKALRKEPELRYLSARELAEDLERWSRGLPVIARPTTVGYRIRKYVRRNRWGLAAVSLVVGLSLAFAVVSGLQQRQTSLARDEARREATRSNSISEFLLELFAASDPRLGEGEVTARDLLHRGIERADAMADDPTLQGEMLFVMGRALRGLGEYDRAEEVLDRALVIHRSLEPADPEALGATLREMGQVRIAQGQAEDAATRTRESLDIRMAHHGSGHPAVARVMSDLGSILVRLGQYAEAESLLSGALVDLEQELGPEHPDVLSAMNNLFDVDMAERDFEGAVAAQETVLVRRRRVLGPDHPEVATSLNNLAVVNRRLGENAKAEQLYRESIEIKRRLYDGPHADIARSLDNMGIAIGVQGRYDEAEPVFLEALRMREELLGPDHPALASSWNNLSVLMSRKGDHAKAAQYSHNAVDVGRRAGAPAPRLIGWMGNLASAQSQLGQHAEAMATVKDAADWAEEAFPPGHGEWLRVWGAEAKVYLEAGRLEDALRTQEKAHAQLLETFDEGHADLGTSHLRLGRIQRERGELATARTDLERALIIRRDRLPADHPQLAEALHEWGALLAALDDADGARAALDEALQIRESRLGSEAAPTRATREILENLTP